MKLGQPGARRQTVLVAVSGGVSSFVAAALLKSQGYDISGIYFEMKSQSGDFRARCSQATDPDQIRKVFDRLEIPVRIADASHVFEDRVVDDCVHQALQSAAANACLRCQSQVSLPLLYRKAEELGMDWVATGHYAQISHDASTGEASLRRAMDPGRDQSFYLYSLSQRSLRKTLMPLGGLPETMIQRLAAESGLNFVARPEMQSKMAPAGSRIGCFAGSEEFGSFVDSRTAAALRPAGQIRTQRGEVLAAHSGIHRFVVGQQLSQHRALASAIRSAELYYVLDLDPVANAVIVGDQEQLDRSTVMARDLNWVRPVDGLKCRVCLARLSLQGPDVSCRLTVFENGWVQVDFQKPQRRLIPGQPIVFYDGDEVLGGATIDRAAPPG